MRTKNPYKIKKSFAFELSHFDNNLNILIDKLIELKSNIPVDVKHVYTTLLDSGYYESTRIVVSGTYEEDMTPEQRKAYDDRIAKAAITREANQVKKAMKAEEEEKALFEQLKKKYEI